MWFVWNGVFKPYLMVVILSWVVWQFTCLEKIVYLFLWLKISPNYCQKLSRALVLNFLYVFLVNCLFLFFAQCYFQDLGCACAVVYYFSSSVKVFYYLNVIGIFMCYIYDTWFFCADNEWMLKIIFVIRST